MPQHPSLAEQYPPGLRAPLVDWATRPGSARRTPPDVVAEHLVGVFDAAYRHGRTWGIWLALLVGGLPAVVVLVLALVLDPVAPE